METPKNVARIVADELPRRGLEVPKDIFEAAYPGKIVNLIPHEVNILDSSARVIKTFAAASLNECVSVKYKKRVFESIDTFPIFNYEVASVVNLPDPVPNTYFIVSSLVAEALPHRNDLLVVAGVVRERSGRVVGCTHLARYEHRRG